MQCVELLTMSNAVTLIYPDVKNPKLFIWTGAARFSGEFEEIKAQLPGLACQALAEIAPRSPRPHPRYPEVVHVAATLAERKIPGSTGYTVYFSSGIHGAILGHINGNWPNKIQGDESYLIGQLGGQTGVSPGLEKCLAALSADLFCTSALAIQSLLAHQPSAGQVHKFVSECQWRYQGPDLKQTTTSSCGAYNSHHNDVYGCQQLLDKLQVTEVGTSGTTPNPPTITPDQTGLQYPC